jgi:hypothetical protein
MKALLVMATAGIAAADKLGHPSGAVSSSPGSHAVFLSYASQDAEAAQRICEALRAGGIEVSQNRTLIARPRSTALPLIAAAQVAE